MLRACLPLLIAACVVSATAPAAIAQPGQCSYGDLGEFNCEVAQDGAGASFALPDGRQLSFTGTNDGAVEAFLSADADRPRALPRYLGVFKPATGQAGCWQSTNNDLTFCALIEEINP